MTTDQISLLVNAIVGLLVVLTGLITVLTKMAQNRVEKAAKDAEAKADAAAKQAQTAAAISTVHQQTVLKAVDSIKEQIPDSVLENLKLDAKLAKQTADLMPSPATKAAADKAADALKRYGS